MSGLDVELAVGGFHKTVRAGDDHRANGVLTLDVGVVVDLDPARPALQPETLSCALQQRALGGCFGHLAAKRFFRVLHGMRDRGLSWRRVAAR